MKNPYSSLRTSTLILFLLSISSGLFAQGQNAIDIALRYLEQNKEELNLTADDIRNHVVSDHYVSPNTQVTHVFFKQTHNGIEVYNAINNVHITSEGEVLTSGNRFVSNLAARVNTTNPSLSNRDALRIWMNQRSIPFEEAPVQMKEQISSTHFIYNAGGLALEDIPVKLIYQPTAKKEVRLAWNVELYELDAQNWYNVAIDAVTGEVLRTHNQVLHCSFGPIERCEEDHVHTTSLEAFGKSHSFREMDNPDNSYLVFPAPVESPNHGVRSLVTDPADPISSPFGWHDTNGLPGAEFDITRGNNVHAYQDVFNTNASIGDEPNGGPTLDFLPPLNINENTPYVYAEAAVTNLFYWCNLTHDVWWHAGFDEAAGNFQSNNYGNGGQDGDWIRAEALDGSGSNNANFSSGGDGSTARIQMYIWGAAPQTGGGGLNFEATAPAGVAGEYDAVAAGFGSAFPSSPGLSSEVVVIDDGVGVTSDACDVPIVNGGELAGKIALIDRGDCEFGSKVLRAENEGAIAVIMCNNVGGAPITMGAGAEGGLVTIPSLMINQADCAVLRQEIPGLTVQIAGLGIPQPGPTARDGDYDNGVVAHEYGHGMSIRPTGGPSAGGCLGNEEQMGEGWSDYFGMVMTIEPGDQGTDKRGMGTYASGQGTNGDGIRNFPYSTDFALNSATYDDIRTFAIPHGVGEVWGAMLWDMTWAMIDLYGFDEDMINGNGGNNMAMKLVMEGIKMQPCNPGFVDGRDAILAADQVLFNGVNQCLIWEAFARRGLGFSATQGSSGDRGDGVEAFDIPSFCINNVLLQKSAPLEVDAGGLITYTLDISNPSPNDYTGVVITDVLADDVTYVPGSLSCAGSVTGNTLTATIGDIASGENITCTFQVQAPAFGSQTFFFDDVEAEPSEWFLSSGTGNLNWEQVTTNPSGGSFSWFASNPDTESDYYLETANPVTISGSLVALVFDHSYNTEALWDGGVVEIRGNAGIWQDLGNFIVENGYNATITENPASAISQRQAFTGNSNGYITTVIFLNAYMGQEVNIRFRFASDGAVGGDGWHIDNIRIADLVNIQNEACLTGDEIDGGCDDVGFLGTIVIGDETTTSTETVINSLGVSLYPNPTDGRVEITLANDFNGPTNFNVFRADGRVVMNEQYDAINGPVIMDLSRFDAGIYLIQIENAEGTVTKKVVVQ